MNRAADKSYDNTEERIAQMLQERAAAISGFQDLDEPAHDRFRCGHQAAYKAYPPYPPRDRGFRADWLRPATRLLLLPGGQDVAERSILNCQDSCRSANRPYGPRRTADSLNIPPGDPTKSED